MDSTTQDIVEFALAYPFHIPEKPYLLLPGGKVSGQPPDHKDRTGRIPVLATGSNRSPRQLLRKFPDLQDVLPVDQGFLDGHDVVYSAHLTRYGSVPAALAAMPNCRVRVSVTWLTETQLERMHQTEALGQNYDYGRLDGVSLAIDGGEQLGEVFAYISRRGFLAWEDRPIPLAAIAAEGRNAPALKQREALDLARSRLTPESSLTRFVVETVNNESLRTKRNQKLSEQALPSGHPNFVKETV